MNTAEMPKEGTDYAALAEFIYQKQDEIKSRLTGNIADFVSSHDVYATIDKLDHTFPDFHDWVKQVYAQNQEYIIPLVVLLGETFLTAAEYAKTAGKQLSFFNLWPLTDDGVISDEAAETFMKYLFPGEKFTDTEKATRVKARKPKEVLHPLDKPNSVIWGQIGANTHGQIQIKAERVGTKKEVSFLWSIDFDELDLGGKAVKRLTAYDKRVYEAIAALWYAGNEYITLQQIYQAMGYTGKMGAADRERIDTAISKFHAVMYLSNAQEIAAGYKYPVFKYDGPLLHFERETVYMNGKLVDGAIHIIAEPPMLRFAKERGQITHTPLKQLQSPIKKTETNLAIEEYLITRIARARNSKKKTEKILWSKLKEKSGLTHQTRLAQAVTGYLDWYKQTGDITGYTTAKDGVTITL